MIVQFQIGNRVTWQRPRGPGTDPKAPPPGPASFLWSDGGDRYDGDGVLDGGDDAIEGDCGDVDVDHVDVGNGEDVDDGSGDDGDGDDGNDDDGDGDQNNLSLLSLVQGALVQPLPPAANINSFPSCHLKWCCLRNKSQTIYKIECSQEML